MTATCPRTTVLVQGNRIGIRSPLCGQGNSCTIDRCCRADAGACGVCAAGAAANAGRAGPSGETISSRRRIGVRRCIARTCIRTRRWTGGGGTAATAGGIVNTKRICRACVLAGTSCATAGLQIISRITLRYLALV